MADTLPVSLLYHFDIKFFFFISFHEKINFAFVLHCHFQCFSVNSHRGPHEEKDNSSTFQ